MDTVVENLIPSRNSSLKQRIAFAEDPVELKEQGFRGYLKLGSPPLFFAAKFILFPFFRTTVVMYSVKDLIHKNLNHVELCHRRYWWRARGENAHLVQDSGYSANIELNFRLPFHLPSPGMLLYLDDAVLFDPNASSPDHRFCVPVILLGRDFFLKFPHVVANFQVKHEARDEPRSIWSDNVLTKFYELSLHDGKHVMAHLELCNGPPQVDSAALGMGIYFEPHSAYNTFAAVDKYGPDGRPWDPQFMIMRAWLVGVTMIINAVENYCSIGKAPKSVIISNRYGDLLSRLRPGTMPNSGLKGLGLEKILKYVNDEGEFGVSFKTTTTPAVQWVGGPTEAVKALAMAGAKMVMVTHRTNLNLLPSFNRYDLFETFNDMMKVGPDGRRIWWDQADHIYVGVDGVFRCSKSHTQREIKRADDIGKYEEDAQETLLNFVELRL
ncbi:uncharacterized protein LAJ45_05769 [Morchella importuna]|uniref:Uncharacterized protein n=1 Tax=Morchella conica CCBAS932 TaxID=1392247 RepID=A0A3N4KCD3_9PEZI|nr:uncharacterized protein LAJ45_05769 [Morchella importuna]KAH8150083.1 hypothetical protein LAJ45_05769 [Morchella importuna]RPB08194.1 hypothetical protein P167DRAFT_608939 [Morchella conica CCBAS932]